MTILRKFLSLLVIWMMVSVSPAISQESGELRAVSLRDEVTHVAGKDVLYLRETAELSYDGASAWAARDEFKAYANDTIDFGYLAHPVWVLFKVSNLTNEPQNGVISLGRPELIVADIYTVVDGDAKLLFSRDADDEKQARLRKYLALAEATEFAPGASKTILIRMRSSQSSLLPLAVGSEAAMTQAASGRLSMFFMFTMMALTIIAVNAVLIVMLGHARLLWFPVSQLVSLANAWQMNRLPNLYLEPMSRELSRFLDEALMLASVLLLLQFARCYFRTWLTYPAIDKGIRALMGIGICLVAIEFFGLVSGLYAPGTLIGGIILTWLACLAALIWTAFAGVRRGVTGSWPMLAAWVILGGLVSYMVVESILPLPPLPYQTDVLVPLVALEAFLVTHALGLFARRNTQDKFAAEQKLTSALRKEIITMQDLTARSRLLLAMGHDGRNLVGGLNYLSSGIGNAKTLDEAKAFAARLRDVSSMLDDMLNIMVDSAVSGQGTVAIEPVNIETLLSTVRIVSGAAAATKAIPIDIHIGVEEVMTDHVRVFRILTNLVSNAGKYSERGRILIACRRSGEFVRFQVYDQGEGLDAKALQRLRAFEPVRFNQQTAGEGVGLTICHEFAQDLGGELRMLSQPGRGSLFELCIPAPKPESLHANPVIGTFGAANDWPAIDSNLTLVALDKDNVAARAEVDVVLVDDQAPVDVLGTSSGAQTEIPVLVATFDKSSEKRAEWDGKARALLYKPVTTDAVLAALAILGISRKQRIEVGRVDDAYIDRRRS